jgi:hypothetical protein
MVPDHETSSRNRDRATQLNAQDSSRPERCLSVRPPSSRAIHGLFDWVDQHHAAQRTWARNRLIAVGLLGLALAVLMSLGLI